jgi:c-di-GMP-binding flagellar brake protein YcgR
METIDLSGSGAALLSSIYLPLKTQVSVAMLLPAVAGQRAVDLRCEAVVVNIEEIGHERKRWKAGLYFLDLAPPEQQALKKFVYGALEAPGEPIGSSAAQGGGSGS